MQNQMMNMLMQQIKIRNPQAFQMVEQAQKNNGNPVEMFKEITKGYTPEKMESFYKQVEQMGFPIDLINQLK